MLHVQTAPEDDEMAAGYHFATALLNALVQQIPMDSHKS